MSGLWGRGGGPALVAGPCVLESDEVNLEIGDTLAALARDLGLPVIYKGSFDKANRSGASAPRGPGLEAGLTALERVRAATGLAVLTDIHLPEQAAPAASVVDALQIPAFLCRQTDLLAAAGETGRPVNIKKGQWMEPEALAGAVAKVRAAAGETADVAVTERGTFFGYGDLIVDMRSFRRVRESTGCPVLFDATHAVQQPWRGAGGTSGGSRADIPGLLRAAAGAGADGFFIETHPHPARAPSDGATMWPLAELRALVEPALEIWHRARAVEVG
jgi:2-dehydro-3-deoxyphosphooctonate aldolase (KDO 8-P synthase)